MAEVSREIQHIRLNIYDLEIPINVPADQEKHYRDAAVLVNDRLNAYFKAYKGKKGDKEIQYYALLDIALNCVKQSERNDLGPVVDVLKELTSEIEEVLK